MSRYLTIAQVLADPDYRIIWPTEQSLRKSLRPSARPPLPHAIIKHKTIMRRVDIDAYIEAHFAATAETKRMKAELRLARSAAPRSVGRPIKVEQTRRRSVAQPPPSAGETGAGDPR